MIYGEFIAVKLSVSGKYAIDSPLGTNDEGTTSKNRKRKREEAVGWALFQTAGCWCAGRLRRGEGWGYAGVSANKCCSGRVFGGIIGDVLWAFTFLKGRDCIYAFG